MLNSLRKNIEVYKMWLKLSTFFLLPVLFIQGHKVRKNTPRLAEAKGEREGRAGQGKSLSLLILGILPQQVLV